MLEAGINTFERSIVAKASRIHQTTGQSCLPKSLPKHRIHLLRYIFPFEMIAASDFTVFKE